MKVKTINSRIRHTWNVISQEYKESAGEKRKQKRLYFSVECSVCGYKKIDTKSNIARIVVCPGCSGKPAAVKTDHSGNCINICEIGTIEFVREFQKEHGVSEREAVRQFVETVKAHLPAGDPIAEKITNESVRAKVRRETGKKSDSEEHNSNGAVRPKKEKDTSPKVKHQETRKAVSDIFTIQQYVNEHLPGHLVVKIPSHCTDCGHKKFNFGFFCEKCQSRGAT